jgi:hypothetical protein
MRLPKSVAEETGKGRQHKNIFRQKLQSGKKDSFMNELVISLNQKQLAGSDILTTNPA